MSAAGEKLEGLFLQFRRGLEAAHKQGTILTILSFNSYRTQWRDAFREFPEHVKERMKSLCDALILAENVNAAYPEETTETGKTTLDVLKLHFEGAMSQSIEGVRDEYAKDMLARILLARGSTDSKHTAHEFNFADEASQIAAELGLSNGWYGKDVAGVTLGRVCQAVVRGKVRLNYQPTAPPPAS